MNNNEIYKQLKDLISTDGSGGKLDKWSENYLVNHRKRYFNDLDLVNKYYKEGKILEIGSAPYHLTYMLSKRNYPVVGVDIDPSRFKQFIEDHDLQVVKCDIESEELPFAEGEFHFILFNEIFEHLRINPIATLRKISRILHPDGTIIITTPNLYSIRNIINFLLGKGFDDPFEQFNRLEEIGHMGHVREYSAKQTTKFLENTGFKSKKVLFGSFKKLTGAWMPFNLVRKVFPRLHTFQIHIAGKENQ